MPGGASNRQRRGRRKPVLRPSPRFGKGGAPYPETARKSTHSAMCGASWSANKVVPNGADGTLRPRAQDKTPLRPLEPGMDTHPALNGAEPRRAANGPAPTRAEPVTLQEAAERLELSIDQLRRRMRSSGIRGALVPAEHGGRRRVLTPEDLDALRRTAPTGANPSDRSAPTRAEPRQAAPTGDEPADPPEAEPWRRLVAELTAERDRARAELATVRERLHQAEQRAEEAERGRHVAEQRVSDLRAAWYRWRFAAGRVGLLARLRGHLPPEPAELTAGAALAPPVDP